MINQRPAKSFQKNSVTETSETRLHVLRQTMSKATRGGMFALAGLLSTTSLSFAQVAVAPGELPTGGSVASGSANMDYSQPNHLEITQNSQNAVFDWNTFNIGQSASTNFNQTQGSSSVAVNRVHDGNPSQILGSLTANGNVVVLNQNGVFFGESAHVDVGGLIASTGELDFDNFNQNGTVKLTNINAKGGSVINKGQISVKDGGLAAFVAPNVVNDGIITAKLGKVALAAGGDKATVDLYGDGLVELALDDKASKALIENNGTIKADGGTVAITVKAAKEIADSVINMGGVVEANTIGTKNGKIILGATNADVKVTGKINAKGGNGKVDVRSNKNVRVTETAEINLDAGQNGNGGTANLIADQSMVFLGALSSRGGAEGGNGGDVEISGYGTLGYDGLVDLSAANGARGTLLLDPTFAIIHNGNVPAGWLQDYVISANKLALTLANSDVVVDATNFIDVGTAQAGYTNMHWTGNAILDGLITVGLNALNDGAIDVSTWNFLMFSGETNGNLTLKSQQVNFNRKFIMGNGTVTVDADTINMSDKLYAKDGSTLLDDSRLIGTNKVNTIKVLSNNASINQSLWLADDATAPTTINVSAGTYNESVNVNKANVALQGANAGIAGNGGRGAETIIQPNSPGFYITANDVTVDGFTVNGADNGIHANGAANVKVLNNIVTNSSANGIYLNASTGGLVDGNKVNNTGTTGHGIAFENGSHNSTASNNVVTNTGYNGIYSMLSNGIKIQKNVINNTGLTTGVVTHGISIETGNNGEISENTVSNSNDGILVYDADNTSVLKNTVYNTARNGISVIDSLGAKVNYNAIGYTDLAGNVSAGAENIHGDAIYVADAWSNDPLVKTVIKGNKITDTKSMAYDNGSGIQVVNSKNVTIGGAGADQNVIKNTQWDGIRLYKVDDATVVNNDINTVARVGIYMQSNNRAVIDGNVVKNTLLPGVGAIMADFGSDYTIKNNIISNAAGHGIKLYQINGANSVDNNTISSIADDGINADQVAGLTVTKNKITGGIDGVHILNSNGAVVGGTSGNKNTIENTTGGWGHAGVLIENGSDNTVSFNDISGSNGDGVRLQGTSGAKVLENTIKNSAQSGIAAKQSASALIKKNNIDKTNVHGISLELSNDADIIDNIVKNAGVDGINLYYGNKNAEIYGNKISNSGQNGIHLDTAGGQTNDDAIIGKAGAGNTITNSGTNGIFANKAKNVKIDSNTITTAGLNGIYVLSSTNADILNNKLTKITNHGIFGETSNDLYIYKNTIGDGTTYGAKVDGINVKGGRNAVIDENTVQGGLGLVNAGAGRDGIHVEDNREAVITDNTVKGGATFIIIPGGVGAGRHGIYVSNSGSQLSGLANAFSTRDGVQVTGNKILNTGLAAGAVEDGIHIVNSGGGLFGDRALVQNNTVRGVGNDGIFVSSTNGANIDDNDVSIAGGDGIEVADSSLVDVTNNTVSAVAGNGILMTTGLLNNIAGNTISAVGLDGINASYIAGLTIDDNDITLAGVDGIDVRNVADADITNNRVEGALSGHGIYVDPSINVTIDSNFVAGAALDGIHADDVLGLTITNNFVTLTGDDGIDVQTSADVLIGGNTTLLTTGDGIQAGNVLGLGIYGNNVLAAGDDGIDVDGALFAEIAGNLVMGTEANGIEISNAGLVNMAGNTVLFTGEDGINATNVGLANIAGNTVGFTADDGIDINNGLGVLVAGNTTFLTGGDGIEASNVLGLGVYGNTVVLAGDDGIDIDNAALVAVAGNTVGLVANNGIEVTDTAGVLVAGNNVFLAGGNGIDLDGTIGSLVLGNTVTGVAGDGIRLDDSALSLIAGNNVAFVGGDGIDVDDSALVGIVGNNVFGALDNGIEVSDAAGVLVAGNTVVLTGGNGIDLDNTFGTAVVGNNVFGTLGHGIAVDDSALSLIAGNNIAFTLRDGINIDDSAAVAVLGNDIAFAGGDGIDIDDSNYILVGGNNIDYTLDNGIEVSDSANALIVGNNIGVNGFVGGNGIDIRDSNDMLIGFNDIDSNVQGDGIYIDPSDDIYLLNNTINEVGGIGINVDGQGNGDIKLAGNYVNVRAGGVGARFESGTIDLTSSNYNTFNGGAVGLLFDPGKGGDPNGLKLVNDGNPAFGGTIGQTHFIGQTQYYVELENGAFFNPGTPTLLNGYDATFDGQKAADMNNADYANLQNMIWDYMDTGTVGLFFPNRFGAADINDILPQDWIVAYNAYRSPLLTITGLPFAPGARIPANILNGLNALNANALNNIASAAGGQQANGDGSEYAALLNSVQTSAGETTVGCWRGVYSNLGASAKPVTYNFNVSPVAQLSDQATCAN